APVPMPALAAPPVPAPPPEGPPPGAPPAVAPPPPPVAPGLAVAGGPTLRYRRQDAPAVYAVNVTVENDRNYEVQRGYTTVRVRPGRRAAAPAAERKGTGTGFVVHADGYLITCAHVVDGATKIDVAVGGRSFPGTVQAIDHAQDLALVRIPANGLPTVPLGDSGAVELGAEVWAVGFPLSSVLGDNIKITKGTLSGINREAGHKVFQIDASINPGNSGGPLFTAAGGVLGVNRAKLAGEAVSNVGFATPSNEAARMLRDKGVAFAAANPAAKLDGPTLIRQVSPAVALLTVTIGPGAAGEPLTVGFTTNLGRSVVPRDAGPPAAVLPEPGYGGAAGEIDTDGRGEIASAPRNDVPLPALLGGAGRFLIEPLPSGGQPTWEKMATWVITQGDARFPFRPGFPGRPRPPFPPMPFGPPGGPFGGGGEEKKQIAVERSVYTRQAVDGDRVTIRKAFELRADATDDMAAFTFTGTKVTVFDAKAGLPVKATFTGELVEKGKDQVMRLPVTASYRLLEGADRDRVVNVKAPPPPPPEPPLTGDVLTEALKDVAGADRFKRSQAANRLKRAKPEGRREDVTKVLTGLIAAPGTDSFHRRACVEALGVWGTPDAVPVLLPMLDSTDVFLRGSAITALGALKDTRAAEPLAKKLGELGDRMAASAALKAIGRPAEAAVAGQLANPEWTVRMEAARILKEIGTAASKPALQKASSDSNGLVARLAKEALEAAAKR
ncbi:MAG: trypsin-like peptidase domain-containing protein, partial [Gemmataceae bacterium]